MSNYRVIPCKHCKGTGQLKQVWVGENEPNHGFRPSAVLPQNLKKQHHGERIIKEYEPKVYKVHNPHGVHPVDHGKLHNKYCARCQTKLKKQHWASDEETAPCDFC
jgi:hypothetical protein